MVFVEKRLRTWEKVLLRLELVYFTILPFAGFIALYSVEEKVYLGTLLVGWITVLIYHATYLPILIASYREELPKEFPRNEGRIMLLPALLIGISQALSNGSVAGYLVEKTTLVFVSYSIAITIIYFFYTDETDSSSWKTLGCIPMIIIAPNLLTAFGFLESRIESYSARTELKIDVVLFVIALLFTLRSHLKALHLVVKRTIVLRDIFPNSLGIVLWVLSSVGLWYFVSFLAKLISHTL